MVRNTHGGSGHKSQARKNTTNPKQYSSKLRLRNVEDDEVYAQVLKILGGGMCSVLCDDNIERLCIIRGKFRGRGKRDNTLYGSCWVLVALRTWAASSNKGKEQCDLLEIYSESDKNKLQASDASINWSMFIMNDRKNTAENTDTKNTFEFSDEQMDEYKELVVGGVQKITMTIQEEGEEEVDVDDI